MFGIDSPELLVIAIVALVVIGPKELPGLLRSWGNWMAKMRGMAAEFGLECEVLETEQMQALGMGALLGVLVTLSSVGAGAIGVTALLLLYPKLPVARVVGADIAHAVPMTLVAGVGHWWIGSVNIDLANGGALTGTLLQEKPDFVDVDVAGLLPADTISNGFDNVADSQAQLTVADTGPGVPQQFLPRTRDGPGFVHPAIR